MSETKLLPPEEYYKTLPRKITSTGAIIFNGKEELLIVKPSYKPYWLVPGGTVEENETPRAGCRREIKEEIGLDVAELGFLGIIHMSAGNGKTESLQFFFDGGVLGDGEIARIKIDGEEIVEYRFAKVDEALALLGVGIRFRVASCLEARKAGKPGYFEGQN